MSDIECPICKSNAVNKNSNGFDNKTVSCPRCGDFSITSTASAMWKANNPSVRQVTNASGWIREHQRVLINSNEIEALLSVANPSVAERAKKILMAIERLSTDLSYSFDINLSDANYWRGISYSDNPLELIYLFSTYLINEVGYLSCTQRGADFVINGIRITPKGYEFLDSLKHTSTRSQIGFCAMWFDESVLPIWTNAIEPAIKNAGYDAKRIDTDHHNNRIDDEIIAMIRRSKFVVADFTGQRGGVYFEAGFALGLGLQVIWTCKKSDLKEVHFDNRQYNFVVWEEDKLDDFKVALQNRIEATIGRGNFS